MKLVYAAAAAALVLAGGYALAQTAPTFQSAHVNPTDLFPHAVNGVATAQTQFVTAPQISGPEGYFALNKGADAHGDTLTYTATAGVVNIFAYATTSAITSVTITTEANPGDGQRECYVSVGEATTTLTFTANTGQSLNAAVAAISSASAASTTNTSICITYVANQATWYRSN